ncbi:transposase [Lacipirellula sp.]|uniref:transposase n=1 Tax=Lacipirellula sp. TaxID=2691419 RepID=UPI003D0B4822
MSDFKPIRKSSSSSVEHFKGRHRFEHWYIDNQVYFLTARCRDRRPVFATEQAKAIFWDRFDHYAAKYGFVPWITSLLDNHYHTLGYLRIGKNLGPMMQRIRGSVAKLVNDTLPERRVPFWSEEGHRDYFDGAIRDEKQCRRAYKYTLQQAVRHGIAADWGDYPHTRVAIDLDRGVKRALELKAFLEGVPYKRYQNRKPR